MMIVAYIDPGLGLMAWQALVAAVLGTLFYLKKTRTWLMRLLCKPFRSSTPPDGAAKQPPTSGSDPRQ
jgi:hypothetical protein